jgi:DNA-binding LacI/PurR family transcriptional regulator
VVDDEQGSRVAVEHLLGLGHRRVGFLGIDADTDTARRRLAGYRSAMNARRLPVEPGWITAGPPTEEGGRRSLRAALGAPGPHPTAWYVASLMSAIGALAELRDTGADVPGDVSVVAFNDHPLAAHTAPPLTTVRMPNVRMGEEAVGMLLAAMAGEPVRDLVIEDPPELIVRASTAPPLG